MKIVSPKAEIVSWVDYDYVLKLIERIGRVCYKSEDNITGTSAEKFIQSLIKRGHESVIEHFNVTVNYIIDRGISHEIVRHRIASYAQESTRYCNYSADKFDNQISFIKPFYWTDRPEKYNIWMETCQTIESNYLYLLENGTTPQEARGILPTCVKTELFMTTNLREWRHFFKLRTAKAAHPQIREIAIPLLKEFKKKLPVFFFDIEVPEE